MRVAGAAMIVSVVCQILNKSGREEQATLVSVTGMVIILALLVERIGTLFDTIREVFGL